jgi:hypothetical protein
MTEVVGRSWSAKRIHHIETFPDDLMHVIFAKLEFRDKVNASQVCKQWDELLKAGTANARHWVVDYNVDTIVSSKAFEATKGTHPAEQLSTCIERCVTVFSAGFSRK